MLTAYQLDEYQKKLHGLRANLDDRAPSLREEACHGAGGEDVGGLSNAPIHLGDMGAKKKESS